MKLNRNTFFHWIRIIGPMSIRKLLMQSEYVYSNKYIFFVSDMNIFETTNNGDKLKCYTCDFKVTHNHLS